MLADVQLAIEALPLDEPFVLLADFDGTLAEFHPNPAVPTLSEIRRAWLRKIAAQPLTYIGIVSGRRVSDLRRRAPLPPHSYYAGLHGMEIEQNGRHWQHPDLERARTHVEALVPMLAVVVDAFPGAVIENKEASVAVHARGVADGQRLSALALADAIAGPWTSTGRLRRLEGSLVVEFLPDVAWHKGDATDWIAADVEARSGRPGWVVFLGDDITDEDAFRGITRGIGVLVGSRPTAATHQLDGIADVDTLLGWLAARQEP
jgi:trehalose 6-phosphate phosphatase